MCSGKIKLNKLIEYGLYLFVFLLPWQTRWMWHQGEIGGGSPSASSGPWEYRTFSLYATDILLAAIFVLGVIWWFKYEVRSLSSTPKGLRPEGKSEVPARYARQAGGRSSKIPDTRYQIQDTGYRLVWYAIAALELLVFLSLFWSADRGIALYYWIRFLLSIALFWLVLNVKFNFRKLSMAIVASGVLQGLLGIWQFVAQQVYANKWLGLAAHLPQDGGTFVVETVLRRWLRAYGSLPHPNMLAGFLVIAFLLLLGLALQAKTSKGRFLLFGAEIVILVGLFFTFSRGAWLALVIALLPACLALRSMAGRLYCPPASPCEAWRAGFIAFLKKDVELNKRFFTQLLVIGALIIAILSLIFWPPLSTRLRGTDRLEIKSTQERVLGYEQASQMIKEHWLLGVGAGNYTVELQKKYPNLNYWEYQPVHNAPLLVLAEVGVAGVLLWLVVIGVVLVKLRERNGKILNFLPRRGSLGTESLGTRSGQGFLIFDFRTANDDSRAEKHKQNQQSKISNQKFLLLAILLISLFDHYFWSLAFGILLWWLVLGLAVRGWRYQI